MLAVYANLAKPRILFLLIFVAVISAFVAGEGSVSLSRIVGVILVGGLSSAGAAYLNNYFDRRIDAAMARTRNRPLPTGKIQPGRVLLIGLGLVAVATLISLRLNYLVALSVLLGAFIYVGLYTLWLKRRSPLNIVIGGLAGSCIVLVGWFAVDPRVTVTLILMVILLFLWTPAHFWSFAIVHKESYQAAMVPMLPVCCGDATTTRYILLHAALLFAVSLVLYFAGGMGKIYLGVALLLSGAFLLSSIQLWRYPQKRISWRNYKLSGIYLLGLFLGSWLMLFCSESQISETPNRLTRMYPGRSRF